MFKKQIDKVTFLPKIYLSICSNIYKFSDFFLIFEIFFFFYKMIKSRNLDVFVKRLGITLKKFLGTPSKRFTNTTKKTSR